VKRVAVVAVVAALVAACRSEPPRGVLVPVVRWLDAPAPTQRADMEWGRHVKIAGESRLAIVPTIDPKDPLPAVPPPNAAKEARWGVPVPDALRATRWLLARPVLVREQGPPVRLQQLLIDTGTGAASIPVPEGLDPTMQGIRLMMGIEAARPLASYDVVGAPFVVPADAVATVGMGVDEGAWSAAAGPVEFRIGVVDGEHETVLARTTLDPARRPEDRRWADARVDLSPFAGRRVRLALRTAPSDPGRATPSLPLWADPTVLAPRPAWMPNVVLMSLDTLRAKSVSAYGSARATTPNLDHMVGDAGTIFDNAYTTAPHTLPAHLSAFTGLYRRSFQGVNAFNPLPLDVPTLPERLRAAGYETGAFTEDGFVIPNAGFQRGFSTYVENTSPNFHEPLGQSAKTFRAAADWLAERRDHPTFLFVHTYEVHAPYAPAPPYDHAFEDAATLPNENAVALLRYEQEARHLDDEVRAFLEAVDGLGLGTRTLLVVMADHGEEFGEHGQRYHGFQLYEETTHVPFMLRWPAAVPAGLRVKTPVSLVDIMPTILDLVGAPPVMGIHGESLVPLLGDRPLSSGRRVVFGEALSKPDAKETDLLSTRTADIHCIFRLHGGNLECYNPQSDRAETVRRSDRRDQIDLSRREADVYWDLMRPIAAAAAAPAPAPAPPSVPAQDRTEQERLEKLRALGYVQ
jgi:arylsulfatase A-like enzyme